MYTALGFCSKTSDFLNTVHMNFPIYNFENDEELVINKLNNSTGVVS